MLWTGDKIRNGPHVGTVVGEPLLSPGSPILCMGDKIRNGQHVGTVATKPLPSRGSPMVWTGTDSEMVHMWAQWLPNPCHCGGPQCSARGQNHKWPTCGYTRYLTPAVSGVPNALHRGIKSQKAHQWAQWPPNPCRLRGPHCFGWGRNRKWPTSGHTGYQTSAVSGVLKAFNGGQNQKWPTCGHNGYLTPAVPGVPNALY